MCVLLFSSAMQHLAFATALSPIYARSRTHPAVQSVSTVASRYPLSSTPLREVRTITQEPVVQKKSSRTGCNAGKPDRKRKSGRDGVDVRVKVAKSKVSTVTGAESERLASSSTVSAHSRVIDSLAGELQRQKHEVKPQ